MARSIDYRSTMAFPAEKVFAAMTDAEYLRARLRELGGPNAKTGNAPASAAGTMTLANAPDGSLFEVRADVNVRVPLIGGKIEEIVAAQVRRLLEAETAFTIRWLGSH